ncbi:MAG TPA: NDP-sugar synthase [Nitriliruptorales bacterium]|nr:NDP-sugar synthase [Nitriliruptorales bacterium]
MSDHGSAEAPVREALIVAGGRGTRLQPLTHDVPKPLLPFCGPPFLEGLIRRLGAAGVQRVHLVIGADAAPFQTLRGPAQRHGIELRVVPEPQPLDTAGGARAVAASMDGPVLVLNGDILTDVDFAGVATRHVAAGADATMVLTRVADTSAYGVALREASRVVRFVEKPAPGSLPGHDTVNAGTYVLQPHVLLAHPEGPLSFERDVFPGLVEGGGHLEGIVWQGVWADLGTPQRYREGHWLALCGAVEWPTVRDVPERGGGVRVAEDAQVHPRAHLIGPLLVLGGARVAAGATVGPHTVLGRAATVSSGAVVERAILHDRVRIDQRVLARGLLAGHDAHVQAGARLGADVVLGSGEVVARGETVPDRGRRPAPRG